MHIRVDGMYNPNASCGYTDFIEYMPFSEKAISKSVTKLVGRKW